MKLVIAEKPSVGRDIARVLKCSQRGEGFLKGDAYIVSWAVGHLVTLMEPDEIDEKYKKWRMDDLPIMPDRIPTKVIPKTRAQYQVLKKLMADNEVTSIICATDAGREGELIFRLIYNMAGCKKPVERLWISSMTDEAIREGFSSLKPLSEYEGLYQSAEARSQADWLVGMNLSRAFTLRYDVLLSIGRVQTPTLAILVKRYHEIADFKPVEYYTLTADMGAYQGQWFDPGAKDEKLANRIPDKVRAAELQKKVKGRPAVVTDVNTEHKRELPPQLYDLTSLQRDANRQLGFTADKTLKLAQSLYEKWKALTYPRTDSRYLPMDMLPRLKQTLNRLPAFYQPLVKNVPLTPEGKIPVSKRVFDNSKVSDHHAILPTPQTVDLSKLPDDERKLFDMVARRTLAALYPAYEYDAVRVTTVAEGESFRSSGRTERIPGYKLVYRYSQEEPQSKKTDPQETALPPLHVGDTGTVEKAQVKKETTKPPAPHTDASLLSAMENAGRELSDEAMREQMKSSGLGTPATRAAIIERLIKVGYAARKGKTLQATEKGVQLIEIAPNELASPEMTGKWELALNEIANGKKGSERFMEGIRRMTDFLVGYAKTTNTQGSFPKEEYRGKKGGAKHGRQAKPTVPDVVCPLCGRQVTVNEKSFGCSGWREGCPFTIWKDCLTRGGGPMLNEKLVGLILKNGTVRGSTGEIVLKDRQLSFRPAGGTGSSVSCLIEYHRKEKA